MDNWGVGAENIGGVELRGVLAGDERKSRGKGKAREGGLCIFDGGVAEVRPALQDLVIGQLWSMRSIPSYDSLEYTAKVMDSPS